MGSLLTGPSLHCRLSAEASLDSGHRGLGLIVALFVLRPHPLNPRAELVIPSGAATPLRGIGLPGPLETLLETAFPEGAERDVYRWLETNIEPHLRPSLKPDILGFILYSRFPAMTATGFDSKGIAGSDLPRVRFTSCQKIKMADYLRI